MPSRHGSSSSADSASSYLPARASRASSSKSTPEASKSKKRRRSERRQSHADEAHEEIQAGSNEIFVVSQILARSYLRYIVTPAHEVRFLVRWEGYGPEDDTWEPRDNLIEGAGAILKEFELREHPFEILDCRGINPKTYLVRYGVINSVTPSPYYQRFWHTPAQIKSRGDIRAQTVDKSLRDFHATQIPSSSPATSPYRSSSAKGSVRSPSIRSSSPTPKKRRNSGQSQDRSLLALLDQRKLSYGKGLQTQWKARWRDGNTIREEWLWRTQLGYLFGKEAVDRTVSKWMENPAVLGDSIYVWKGQRPEDVKAPPSDVSDYERQRLKNIEENKEMMRQLGLLV